MGEFFSSGKNIIGMAVVLVFVTFPSFVSAKELEQRVPNKWVNAKPTKNYGQIGSPWKNNSVPFGNGSLGRRNQLLTVVNLLVNSQKGGNSFNSFFPPRGNYGKGSFGRR